MNRKRALEPRTVPHQIFAVKNGKQYGHGTVWTRYGMDTVRYGHGAVRYGHEEKCGTTFILFLHNISVVKPAFFEIIRKW